MGDRDAEGAAGWWSPLPSVHRGTAGNERGEIAELGDARKDGRDWRIGTAADVAWIRESTTIGMDITAAIPPLFANYATVTVPNKDEGRSENLHEVLRILRGRSGDQPWWLGYLDTGADDVVFPASTRVELYGGWSYVLVLAGPDEAARWRVDLGSWRAPGPDMLFPFDRSWLVSWLWDDDWRCVGGPTSLIDQLVGQPDLEVRRVSPGEDATPPGYSVG